MQKPKYGPAANEYLFLFLGLPRTPTNVNASKSQYVYPMFFGGFWMDGNPNQEQIVQKLCFSTKFRIFSFVKKGIGSGYKVGGGHEWSGGQAVDKNWTILMENIIK